MQRILLITDRDMRFKCGSLASNHKTKKKCSFNIKGFCKVYFSIIARLGCTKKSSSSSSSVPSESAKPSALDKVVSPSNPKALEEQETGDCRLQEEKNMNGVRSCRYSTDSMRSDNSFFKHRSMDHCFPHMRSPLSRNGSRRKPSPVPSSLPKSMSRRSGELKNDSSGSLSRNASRRSTTPIMFSNSTGMVKPPPIQRDLECTLEELCHGCTKKIKITRDVLTETGHIIQEDEILKIRVKPGWKKGTKITFEGMGNERPGTYPADITFVIAEKRHPLYRREGDDLEMGVEIPLIKALTGCEISIPLLGGEKKTLKIDDIIHPGHQKTIIGQGMPKSKEQGERGNLKVVFLVEFPGELTDEQRSEIVSILEEESS